MEDVDTDCEDHAGDTDRYFLMSLKESKGERAKTDIEKKLDEIKKADDVSSRLNDLYEGKLYKPNAY